MKETHDETATIDLAFLNPLALLREAEQNLLRKPLRPVCDLDQALKALAEQRQQILGEFNQEQPPTTVSTSDVVAWKTPEAFELYFRHAEGRLRPKTIRTYKDTRDAFLKEFPDNLPEPQAVDRWISDLDVAQNTKLNRFKHIRTIFRWLHDHHGVPDVTAGLKSPSPSKDTPPFLTSQEIEQVVNMPLNSNWGRYAERDYGLLRIMQRSGIRIGGALGLTQTDLHDGYIMTTQKGKTAPYPCDNETIDLLRKLGNPHIFIGQHGSPLGYAGALRAIKKALKLAGLNRSGLATHVMRRGFATAMNRRGMPTITLSRTMKHSKVQQTEQYVRDDLEALLEQYAKFSPWVTTGSTGNQTSW